MESEGWAWLKDQPPVWEAPATLRLPTSSTALNLGVQIISSNMVGNDLVEIVAEFLAAKARLELWLGQAHPPLSMCRKFVIGRIEADAVRSAYAAWLEYESAFRSAAGKSSKVTEQREALGSALRDSLDALIQARSGEVG